jgi:Tfp pilus assembly PilM family ATPase
METPHIYHNSTNLSGYQLETAIRKATKQNDRVILIYKAKNRPMTPSEVWNTYNAWFDRSLIGSIRRSITNLSATEDRKGRPIIPKLQHTGTLRPVPFGAKEGVWRVVE